MQIIHYHIATQFVLRKVDSYIYGNKRRGFEFHGYSSHFYFLASTFLQQDYSSIIRFCLRFAIREIIFDYLGISAYIFFAVEEAIGKGINSKQDISFVTSKYGIS